MRSVDCSSNGMVDDLLFWHLFKLIMLIVLDNSVAIIKQLTFIHECTGGSSFKANKYQSWNRPEVGSWLSTFLKFFIDWIDFAFSPFVNYLEGLPKHTYYWLKLQIIQNFIFWQHNFLKSLFAIFKLINKRMKHIFK